MKKTLVALFVALCMVLTMAPAMAFAADEPRIESVVFYADKDAAKEAGVEATYDQTFVVTLKERITTDTNLGISIQTDTDVYQIKLAETGMTPISDQEFVVSFNDPTNLYKNWDKENSAYEIEKGKTYTLNVFTYDKWSSEAGVNVIYTTDIKLVDEFAKGYFDALFTTDKDVEDTPFVGYVGNADRKDLFNHQMFYYQIEDKIAGGASTDGYLFEVTVDGKTYSTVGNVLAYADDHATLYGSFMNKGVDFVDKVKAENYNNTYEFAPGKYTITVYSFVGNGYVNTGAAKDIANYPATLSQVGTIDITVQPADYTRWDDRVAYVNALVETDYTADSWRAFEAATAKYLDENDPEYRDNHIETGKALYYQDTINNAVKQLEEAYKEKLVKTVDYTDLKAALALAAEYDEANYTEKSWAALAEAVDNAEDIIAARLADNDKNTKKALKAEEAIRDALWNLEAVEKVELADYTAVNEAIAAAEALTEADYTAESWAVLEAAIAAVQPNLPATQQAEVDAMARTINDAIDALVVEKANYAAVDAAIAKAETLTEADYTADSWAAVEAAINAVVRDLPVSDQAKVDAMAKAINDAIDALVAAEPEDPTDPEDPTEIVFDDVEQGRWSAQYIYDLVEKGICDGIGDNKFNPEGNIERCAFAKILAEASGDDLTRYEGTSNFADCRGSWAETYINWAYENGIVTGRTDTTFDPYGEISRQEMAAMIYRYAEYKGIELPETNELITFDDEEQIADYAAEAVDAMQKAGIINGMDNNEFQPQGTATREQAAKMISVLLSL